MLLTEIQKWEDQLLLSHPHSFLPCRSSLIIVMKRTSYPTLENENDTRERLREMGVSIYVPEEEKEGTMRRREEQKIVEAMEEFSHFVLDEGSESNIRCRSVVQNDKDSTVSELQGGNADVRIYRVSIPQDEEEEQEQVEAKAANLLLAMFHSAPQGKRYRNVFTFPKIRQYMLRMCNRHSEDMGNGERHYSEIGNFMFILQFGGGRTAGQVRHIDNMTSNLQVCLYMSTDCPSTIIYEMENNYVSSDAPSEDGRGCESDGAICGSADLLRYWKVQLQNQGGDGTKLPKLIQDILETMGNDELKQKWYSKYFSFWGTINLHLGTFGKLYQSVAYQHSLKKTQPGTTLIAGGNEVHSGPPTDGPRMFVFGVGYPDDIGENTSEQQADDANVHSFDSDEDNDGEVQYSPVLLHIDFCTLLFCILRHSKEMSGEGEELHKEAKLFLVRMLIVLVKDYPMKDYLLQIDSSRNALTFWLEELLNDLNDEGVVNKLVLSAVASNEIFYTPEVIKRYRRRKTKTRRGNT